MVEELAIIILTTKELNQTGDSIPGIPSEYIEFAGNLGMVLDV